MAGMCGICGIYHQGPSRDVKQDLAPMLRAIAHRGTVDGEWVGEGVALGSRRLPIIDVAHSPQPILNESRDLVLVGNGEIYNFQELRSSLLAKGHVFTTDGDLECILHLYEDLGDDAWVRLHGMFAVALYDRKKGELTLARDRSGMKPLFYAQGAGGFTFASEIRSLRQHPLFRSELNPQAIADYLSLQFVPRPQTVYREISSLPPAGVLKVKGSQTRLSSFWRLDLDAGQRSWTRQDAAEKTRHALEAAVRRHLISDVPLGVLLSGGLDSSGIAALAARMNTSPVKTFAIVFKEKTFDESAFSRQMARHLHTDHHELVLDEDGILDSMPQIRACFDEPFCEGSAIPVFHICRYAKEHVDVLLSGEGADEIFCGYETYAARAVADRYLRIPPFLRSWLHALAHRLPVSDNKVSLDLKLRRLTDGARFSPPTAHFWWRCSLNDVQKNGVLQPEFAARLARPNTSEIYERMYEAYPAADIVQRLMATDCAIHLPDDLLYRADMMSMAHTLELRVPFLDVDLLTHAFSLPSSLKARGLRNKLPLRDALKGVVPDSIRLRTKKGLNMPYQKWFKRPRWGALLRDTLARDRVEKGGVLNHAAVQALLREHEQGRQNHAHGLWTILNLVLWLNDDDGQPRN